MSPTVEVRAIDALEELQTSLVRYADQAQATLAAIAREVQRTLDWLEERQRHWRAEVQRGREEERRARAAYERCLSSGDRDHPPSCGREEQAFLDARRRLAQAEAEERMATQARQAVQAEAEIYARDANRLHVTLQTETVKSIEVLRSKVTVLRSYASGGMSAGGVLAGALAFGAGVVIGAAMGRAGEDGPSSASGVPDSSGRELTLQERHPDIHDILLNMIDFSDSPVHDAADYHKVSKAEMVAGFEKLTQVRRWIGEGATEQQLYDESRAKGLSEVQSYHNIYRVFYGESAIALEKVGDRYRVLNGYHRLAVAQELGWTTIPAKVINS
ncbi:ParB/RepB/Spo0J family partition protein [Candidatus Amarolinea aalborgensis]|uniref:ParB/RepB/Spo0J family partition protein n=1 Tax=Candidatus Amarolinea aalborgensis TaxID=2249329 RepID=UPI003BF98F8C